MDFKGDAGFQGATGDPGPPGGQVSYMVIFILSFDLINLDKIVHDEQNTGIMSSRNHRIYARMTIVTKNFSLCTGSPQTHSLAHMKMTKPH